MTSNAPAQKRTIAIVVATASTKSAQALSNFASQLGLAPALHSVAKAGGDVAALEALEGARGAEYAIVLAAGDDPAAISPLQTGFLLGLVGRKRLCFLTTGKSDPASGPEAVPRHPLDDAGLWRLLLAREMKQAGIEIDLNKAI